MRILIDLRCCQAPPPRGGVARYAEEAVRALLQADSCKPTAASRKEFLLFANGVVHPRRDLPNITAPNARWTVSHQPSKILNATCSLRLSAVGWPKADVVFLPNLNFLPRLPAHTRLVVTVHDLSFEHFADCFTPKERLWHRMVRPRALLQRADAIIAVSETTKRDVMETYGIPTSRIQVVYPGIEHPNNPNEIRMPRIFGSFGCDLEHSDVPSRYILSLSELSPRKNLDGLIAAFELLTTLDSRLATLRLVIAGKHGSATRALERQITHSPARDRIHLLGPVTDDEKATLLSRAHVFAYPSFWEGFGFPPLEAMAAGVPVVASAAGSLPEVLGDAAEYCDPLDPASIARALHRACSDDALRAAHTRNGLERAARYRWETAGTQLLDILTR